LRRALHRRRVLRSRRVRSREPLDPQGERGGGARGDRAARRDLPHRHRGSAPRALKTIRDALLDATQRLERADLAYGHGTTNALDEAAWLVLHAAGLPPFDLDAHLDRLLTAAQERAARDLVAKRIRTRKPAAYLLRE